MKIFLDLKIFIFHHIYILYIHIHYIYELREMSWEEKKLGRHNRDIPLKISWGSSPCKMAVLKNAEAVTGSVP